MMLRKIISFTLFLVLLGSNVFAHTAEIENGGENRYKAVRLTPEIYNNAAGDLSDLRIKDGNGEDAPYFINSGNQTKYESGSRVYSMSLINSYVKNDNFYFDYIVNDMMYRDIPAASIEITTKNTGFAKNIELYGSYDNIYWEFVQNDTLYSVDGKSKLTIEFMKAQKYTHYRFKLGNNLEKISFDSVKLIYNYFTQEKHYFIENLTPDFSVEEKDKKTYISIKGLKNLRLSEIIIETDSIFKRTVDSPFGISKELYNLPFNNSSYTDTALQFNRNSLNSDIFTLTVNNGDDKPINVKGITVKYYADELVFEGKENEKYMIHFGADDVIYAAVYDIVKYKDIILAESIDRLNVKKAVFDKPEEPAIEEPSKINYKMIFNVTVVIVAILLGFLILFNLRKKSV